MKTNINKVISVFPRGSANKLYFEFFNNDGERKQKSTGLKDTKANRAKAWKLAPAFENRLEAEANKTGDTLKEKMGNTLGHYAQKYLESLIANKHTKLDTHAGRIRRLLIHFGEKTLPREITELDIEEFFEKLDVTRDTKSDWKVVLAAIFEKARKDQVIAINIVKQFVLPKHEKQNTSEVTRMPYSEEEIHKLINHADRRLRNYLGIAFNLGLRPEEILGLMERDIDLDAKTIYLKRAVVKGNVKAITPQKGGERDVPLYIDALPFLLDQIAWAKENNSLYLFFDEGGNRLNDSADIRGEAGADFYWNDYLKELNIQPIRRMMNTRHTFAVHCIRNMVELEITLNDIASMMGHTSLRMLLLHYGKYLLDKNRNINRNVSIFQDKNSPTYSSTCFSDNKCREGG